MNYFSKFKFLLNISNNFSSFGLNNLNSIQLCG